MGTPDETEVAKDPVTAFADSIVWKLLATWNHETRRGEETTTWNEEEERHELADGTILSEAPRNITAFNSTVGKIVQALTESDPHIDVSRISIEVHAGPWGRARENRDPAPLRLCDYTGGPRRHVIFWLVLPEK